MKRKSTIKFRLDDSEKSASFLLAGTLFLGPLYLLAFRMWAPALLWIGISLVIVLFSSILGPLTFVLLLMLPFFSEKLVRTWYLEQGWEEVSDGTPSAIRTSAGKSQEKTSALERAQIALLEAQTDAIKKASSAVSQSRKPSGVSVGKDGVPTYQL